MNWFPCCRSIVGPPQLGWLDQAPVGDCQSFCDDDRQFDRSLTFMFVMLDVVPSSIQYSIRLHEPQDLCRVLKPKP